jgi:hypothetical protein
VPPQEYTDITAKTASPEINHEQIRQTQIEKYSLKQMACSIYNCQDHKRQSKTGELLQIKAN